MMMVENCLSLNELSIAYEKEFLFRVYLRGHFIYPFF